MKFNKKRPILDYFYNYSSSGYSFDTALIKEIRNLKKSRKNNIRVLDFGCGKKPFSYLFKDVIEYIGIDVYSGEQVDVVYDGAQIPIENDYFDLVFSTSVLEHVKNLEAYRR